MLSLYDIGCRWPECQCKVPYYAFSQEVRKKYCIKALSLNKGKIMENDNLPTAELVSTETSGYLGPDGKFVYGEPPKPEAETFVQTGEDVVG